MRIQRNKGGYDVLMTQSRITEAVAIMEQLELHMQDYVLAILRSLKFAQDTLMSVKASER